MDWDHFRVFLAVARGGQLSAAARRLGVNHTTVARRLDALEAALGTTLFERRPTGCVLTEAGERLIPVAERIEIEARAAAAVAALRADGRRPGSTLTGVGLTQQGGLPCWLVFNIGDSRVYRLAGDAVEQVTLDHSEVGELVAEGILTPEEALFHPLRNILTRCLGMWPFPGVDTWPLEVTDGVRLLICSDGLTGEVSDARLASILRDLADPQEAADALVAAALEAGGHDNVTVIVLDVAPG